MYRSAIFASLFALACAGPSSNDDTAGNGNDQNADGPPVDATVVVLDAMSGAGVEGVVVEDLEGTTVNTDGSGMARIPVASDSTFELLLKQDGAPDHLLFGPTADEAFQYITFMATDTLITMVLSMLGESVDEGTGVVVVGIDYDDLSPVVGAAAALDVSHTDPWVLASLGASYSDTIPAGGMGMVAFANVQPGEFTASVVPPDGVDCTAFPSGGEMPAAPVAANQVTVVTFHCR